MIRTKSFLPLGAAFAVVLAPPAAGQQVQWDQLPRMQLERQFAGPLRDTVVQRWRDPADGTVCYIYLPISTQHSPPAAGGYVQYGPNTIGSISCMAPSNPRSPTAQPPAGRASRRDAPTPLTPPSRQ